MYISGFTTPYFVLYSKSFIRYIVFVPVFRVFCYNFRENNARITCFWVPNKWFFLNSGPKKYISSWILVRLLPLSEQIALVFAHILMPAKCTYKTWFFILWFPVCTIILPEKRYLITRDILIYLTYSFSNKWNNTMF